ncbi:MAG: hypothetical protein GVY29_10280 [Spirochaetes bacterium]|jgi:Uma2 family endonuclease|nr:hypothetical protein [Spirochaetota bacterium]
MGLPKHKAGTFTYADYLQWPDEERWELIRGIAYDMSPAPGSTHQRTVGAIFRCIADITDGGAGESDESVETVVQPDVSVFCDPGKIDERGATGAPDLVVEVLSPATALPSRTGNRTTTPGKRL